MVRHSPKLFARLRRIWCLKLNGADSGLLEVNERDFFLVEGGLDQVSALSAIFLEASRTCPKLRKTPH